MADTTNSIRYTQLHKVYNSALRATLAIHSYRNFSACFPTPAAYCPQALEGVWKQLNDRLEEECIKDFEKICEERDVANGLQGLETVIDRARARKAVAEEDNKQDTPPAIHELSVQELYQAYVADSMMQTEKELKDKLSVIQDANQELWDTSNQQRLEIEKLVQQVEMMVADVESAAGIIRVYDARGAVEQELKVLSTA